VALNPKCDVPVAALALAAVHFDVSQLQFDSRLRAEGVSSVSVDVDDGRVLRVICCSCMYMNMGK
jgi:hypothetical protein